jgi:tRNA pseudouridine38-40 synthase
LNVTLMKKAARHFVGRHDFVGFMDRGGDDKKTTIRTIKRINITKKGQLIRIEITGTGFLRHMVRIIVGTLMSVGRKKLSPNEIPALIRSGNRVKAGPTAKSQGLTLVRVSY